jgi:hypothetical protein
LLDPLIKNVTNGLKTALMSAFSGTDIKNSPIGQFFSGTLFGGASSTTGPAALGTAATDAAAEVTAFGQAAAATASLSASAGEQDFSGGVAGTAAAASGGGGLFGWLGGLWGFARGGIVPSAAGGWALPSLGSGGILARLDSREMVLPANISTMLQSVAAGRGAGSNNVAYSPTINAGGGLSRAQFSELLSRSHNELSGMMSNTYRNGWRP